MVAIEIEDIITQFSKIPSTWNGILNYNSVNNIEQQVLDGWKDVIIPDYNYLIEKLSELKLSKGVYTKDKIPLSNEAIKINIEQLLGSHLDESYPLWERIKHTSISSEYTLSIMQGVDYDSDKLTYIQGQLDWVTRCRIEAKKMITDLYENKIIPSFEFEKRPV